MPLLLQSDIDDKLLVQLQSVPRIAWDLETSGLDPIKNKIATAQIHAPEIGTHVVRVEAGVPKNLRTLLEDEKLVKVFHHAVFDLRFMVHHWDVMPKNVACTKVAAKLLLPDASSEKRSLKGLLQNYLNTTINKEEQMSDWFSPTLTSAQLAYAAKDVEYLLPLLDRLVEVLREKQLDGLYSACLSFIPTRIQLDLGAWPDVFSY